MTEERHESFDDASKRFTQDPTLFITNEALKILYETCDVQVKLECTENFSGTALTMPQQIA